jgi:hypothetical protein
VAQLNPQALCSLTSPLYESNQRQIYVTTDGQSASLSLCQAPIWGPRPDICYYETVSGLLMWCVLFNERTGLSFTTTAVSCQRSHYLVRVPRGLWPYFTVSDTSLPKPGDPGLFIYIRQEQGGLVTPPDTEFAFRRLLLLAAFPMTHLF